MPKSPKEEIGKRTAELRKKLPQMDQTLKPLQAQFPGLYKQVQQISVEFENKLNKAGSLVEEDRIHDALAARLHRAIDKALAPSQSVLHSIRQIMDLSIMEKDYPISSLCERLLSNQKSQLTSEHYLENASTLYLAFSHSKSFEPDWGLVGIELATALEQELQENFKCLGFSQWNHNPPSLSDIRHLYDKNDPQVKSHLDKLRPPSKDFNLIEQLNSKEENTVCNVRNRCAHSSANRPDKEIIDNIMGYRILRDDQGLIVQLLSIRGVTL